MKALPFACLYGFFISTALLAQSSPVPLINQPTSLSLSTRPLPRGLPFVLSIATASKRTVRLSGVPQTTGLNFAPVVTYGSGGYLSGVVVADVNGDGKPDLLVANACDNYVNGCSSNGEVAVLLGNGDGTFQPAVSYGSGGWDAGPLEVADVNGDGKLDLLVPNACVTGTSCVNGTVGVLLGNGDGTFQTAIPYGSGGYDAFSVTVGDVNGDGKPDVLAWNYCIESSHCVGTIGVLMGNGDGTFQAAISYGSGGFELTAVAMADVNGDGRPDIVASDYCADASSVCATNGTVAVLLGNGDGTFQTAVNYGSGGYLARAAAISDVNGDGRPDLLVANTCPDYTCETNGTVGVLLGNGDGTFRPAVPYGSGGYGALSVTALDVNGDGKRDLLITNTCDSSVTCTNGSLGVLLGNGDGTFQGAVSYGSGGTNPAPLTVADVNGDGFPDLIIADYCSDNTCAGNGTAAVLLSDGDGTFQPVQAYYSGGYEAFSVVVADVNGDGKPDLLVTNDCDPYN